MIFACQKGPSRIAPEGSVADGLRYESGWFPSADQRAVMKHGALDKLTDSCFEGLL